MVCGSGSVEEVVAVVDDIETYCENGVWKTRWQHSAEPFATGGGRERQITKGAVVAHWYGVDHIVRSPDGSIAEHNPTGPADNSMTATAQLPLGAQELTMTTLRPRRR
jgi:hypothetical protein